jgi:DNA-binding transcriptional LysR family regulator
VIERLSRRHPGIAFRIAAEGVNQSAQLNNLTERAVDLLVFRNVGAVMNGQTSFEFLFKSPYVVAAGAGNAWLSRRKIALAELMAEPWALPAPDDAFGTFVTEAFRSAGLEYPHAAVATSALEMRVNLLRTGRYLSIVPEFWLQLPGRHPFIRKLPVELPVTGAPIGIVTVKGRQPSPVVQLFIECAREVAKPLAAKY